MPKILPILLFLLFSGAASATTHTVCSSGCDFTTIQAAVNAAGAGDTVYVYNGTYVENVVISNEITLEGEDNATTTVRSVTTKSGHTITVSTNNVTIKELYVTGAGEAYYIYYGIYAPSVDNFTVTNIDTSSCGNVCDLVISSSTNILIDHNRLRACAPVQIYSSNNLTFTNNIASTNYDGPSAYMSNLNDSVIEDNAFYRGYGGTLTITGANNVSIKNNAVPHGLLSLTNFNNSEVLYNTVGGWKGMHLTSSENVNISHNIHTPSASSSGSAFGIYTSNAITVHNNSINLTGEIYWEGAMFRISNSVNVTATNTTITTVSDKIGKFIDISGTTKEQYNHSIDTTNTLFGEPIYYYFNNTSVNIDSLTTNYFKLAYCDNAVLNNVTHVEQWADKNIAHSDHVNISNCTATVRLDSSDHATMSDHVGSYVYIDTASLHTTFSNCNFTDGEISLDNDGTSYVTISHCIMPSTHISKCDHCVVEYTTFPHFSLSLLTNITVSHNELTYTGGGSVWGTVTNSVFNDNILGPVILLEDNDYISFTSNEFHAGQVPFALALFAPATNLAFTDTELYGTSDGSMGLITISNTQTNVTFTDTTFENAAYAIGGGGGANFIQNNNRVFTGTGGYTIADTSKTNLTAYGITSNYYNYSYFYVTPSAGSVNITDIVWGTTGSAAKTFNLTATNPTANVAFHLGDFGNSVPVQITIDNVPHEIVHTGSNSVLSYTYTDGITAKTQFKFETYDKTTTNPDAFYVGVNNSVDTIGVYEYDDWVTGLTAVTNLSMNTTVATAVLQVTDYTANSTGNFTLQSAEPSCVAVFEFKTIPAGTYASIYTNDVKTYVAKATASNISTYYDLGGFETAATLHTIRVGMGMGNETSLTRKIGNVGSRNETTYLPLLTSGNPIGYKVLNASSMITKNGGVVMINYTVRNDTTVVISEDPGMTPSNLPLVIGGGIAAITVIIYLRRRGR